MCEACRKPCAAQAGAFWENGDMDLDVIRKHSIAGPRYTSYPPATKFTEKLEDVGIEQSLAADDGPRPISLYFHLPFCESRCWFCGCNTVITRQHDLAAGYVADLGREMRLTAGRINPRREISQIHFGGGTPTFLSPAELRTLGQSIAE